MAHAKKRMLLVGKTGSGKSTLIAALMDRDLTYRKTQAITFSEMFVDSPGEFLENRRLYHALLTSSIGCEFVGLVQDASAMNSVYPPKFASMFNRKVVGIVTKLDKEQSCPQRAEKFLRRAGVETIFLTSAVDRTGIESLKRLLLQDQTHGV